MAEVPDVEMSEGQAAPPAADAPEPMDTDEDDPVVEEIDIYLNRMHDPPDFVGDVYLLQYPMRPAYRPYGDQGALDRVEVKEKGRRMRLTYELKPSDNYDGDSMISEKLGGKRSVLTSSLVTNYDTSYAVGVMHQGRLTLVPIRAINQLRPDFEDYDKSRGPKPRAPDVEAEEGDAADRVVSSGESAAEDDGGAAVAEAVGEVTKVEFQAAATTRGQPRGDFSTEDSEPWTRLDYYGPKSEEAKDVYEQHIAWPASAAAQAQREGYEPDHQKLLPLMLETSKEVLLGTMTGQAAAGRRRGAAVKAEDDGGLSVYVLSKMPPERQVEALARQYVVMNYSRQLRRRLPPGTLRSHTDEQLLGFLRNCCVLVCGNWILKSELAGYEGHEAIARDLLLMLMKNRNCKLLAEEAAKWLNAVAPCRIPQRTLDEIQLSVCDRDAQRTLRLKSGPDLEFMRKFPKVVAEYDAFWERFRNRDLAKMRSAPVPAKQKTAAASAAHRQRSRLIGEVREALASGAKTLGELRREIQKRNTNAVIQEQEIQEVLALPELEVSRIRSLFVSGRTGVAATDGLREVLHGLYRSKDTVTFQELAAEYERVHGEPCKASNHVIRGCFREVAEKLDGDNWVLKSAFKKTDGT